jgi:hypothetical protein
MNEYNGDEIITTAPDLRPLLWSVLIVVIFLGVLIFLSMRGEIVATIILAVVGTASLITLGSRLHNTGRKTEIAAQAQRAMSENDRWRLNIEENAALASEQAKGTVQLALAQQRLMAGQTRLLGKSVDTSEETPEIESGDGLLDDLYYTIGEE